MKKVFINVWGIISSKNFEKQVCNFVDFEHELVLDFRMRPTSSISHYQLIVHLDIDGDPLTITEISTDSELYDLYKESHSEGIVTRKFSNLLKSLILSILRENNLKGVEGFVPY